MAPPLEILEYCKVEDLIERENHYLKLLEPEYNILREAGSSLGYIHDEKAKEKMRANRTDNIKIEVNYFKLNTKTVYDSINAAAIESLKY
jgi:group I intron endonuclease